MPPDAMPLLGPQCPKGIGLVAFRFPPIGEKDLGRFLPPSRNEDSRAKASPPPPTSRCLKSTKLKIGPTHMQHSVAALLDSATHPHGVDGLHFSVQTQPPLCGYSPTRLSASREEQGATLFKSDHIAKMNYALIIWPKSLRPKVAA